MYIYPDNLRSKPTMWLWQLRDITVIGVLALVAVLIFSQTGKVCSILPAACYAFLSIRFEDTSILDFIRYSMSYYLVSQQCYEWRRQDDI